MNPKTPYKLFGFLFSSIAICFALIKYEDSPTTSASTVEPASPLPSTSTSTSTSSPATPTRTPTPSLQPTSTATQSLHSEISNLENQGTLPLLDRSSDIRGPDHNGNGVRDDIDAYIETLQLTPPQKKAALQTARVQQRSLMVNLIDQTAVEALGTASMAATACMAIQFESDSRRADDISLKIEAITANTPERAKRYMQYMGALSGTSTAYPEGNTCDD